MLTTHIHKATQVIEAIYTRHTQLDPPVLESDGTDSDNPDLFGGYACHCSRSTPRYTREKPRAFALLRSLCPAWREGLSSLTKGAPKEEDGTDSDVGTEGTPST